MYRQEQAHRNVHNTGMTCVAGLELQANFIGFPTAPVESTLAACMQLCANTASCVWVVYITATVGPYPANSCFPMTQSDMTAGSFHNNAVVTTCAVTCAFSCSFLLLLNVEI